MNNNKLDEAALLAGGKGVFAKTSYITIGTADKPEEYTKKSMERASYKGKQFAYAPPKEGMAGAATNDVYFEKKHNWISDGDKYVDKLRYKDAQPEKKKGFLTSDFHKRDEFSNTIRTEQYREQLTQEEKYSKKALMALSKTAGTIEETTMVSTSQKEEGPLLFDRIFEKEDPEFNGASRTHRWTQNPTQISKDRNLGGQMTSQRLSYQPPTEFEKSEHARKPLVRDTFYRQTNILFPQGVSANPSI